MFHFILSLTVAQYQYDRFVLVFLWFDDYEKRFLKKRRILPEKLVLYGVQSSVHLEKHLLYRTNSVWCKAASCETMWAEHLPFVWGSMQGKCVRSPTSWENTLPVTLLATMWELFVKTLYRTGQWYFPGTKWKENEKQAGRQSHSQSAATGWKLISSRSQVVPPVMCSLLNYIISPTSSSSTCFNLLLSPPKNYPPTLFKSIFPFQATLTQSSALR